MTGRAKHSLREFSHEKTSDEEKKFCDDFDSQKTRLNENLGCHSAEELKQKLFERLKNCSSKPRKDAVACIEVVVTTSAKALQESQEQIFFDKVRKEVSTWYGEENILMSCIHRDETTPHMHLFVCPLKTEKVRKNRLTKKEKESGKAVYVEKTSLSVQKIMGDRKSMSKLQTDFHKHVFSEFGLLRGEIGSRRKNQRPSLQKKEQELQKKEQGLDLIEDALLKREKSLDRQSKELDEKFESYEKALNDYEKTLDERANYLENVQLSLLKNKRSLFRLNESISKSVAWVKAQISNGWQTVKKNDLTFHDEIAAKIEQELLKLNPHASKTEHVKKINKDYHEM